MPYSSIGSLPSIMGRKNSIFSDIFSLMCNIKGRFNVVYVIQLYSSRCNTSINEIVGWTAKSKGKSKEFQ
jgi:hypothetical protein